MSFIAEVTKAYETRRSLILALRNDGHSFDYIGQVFHISAKRVRQIIDNNQVTTTPNEEEWLDAFKRSFERHFLGGEQ